MEQDSIRPTMQSPELSPLKKITLKTASQTGQLRSIEDAERVVNSVSIEDELMVGLTNLRIVVSKASPALRALLSNYTMLTAKVLINAKSGVEVPKLVEKKKRAAKRLFRRAKADDLLEPTKLAVGGIIRALQMMSINNTANEHIINQLVFIGLGGKSAPVMGYAAPQVFQSKSIIPTLVIGALLFNIIKS